MTYLVDANVLSEATKPQPAARVIQWLRANEREIVVDPIILGEIRFGIYLMPTGAKRGKLKRWFSRGVEKIHCLPWDAATGLRWAKLLAELRGAGHSMPIKDSLIAATALVHGLIVVTRKQRDFMRAGVKMIDPFAERKSRVEALFQHRCLAPLWPMEPIHDAISARRRSSVWESRM